MSNQNLDEVFSEEEREEFWCEVEVPFYDKDGERDSGYLEIDSWEMYTQINRLTAQLYASYGYIYMPDYYFEGSSHPQESGVFLQACMVYYLLKVNTNE